ncbi:MAG: hypothetical protein RL374_665, partial [Actinomycetota bacterium]
VMQEARRNQAVPLAVFDEIQRQSHIKFTAVDCAAIGENCGPHSDPKKQEYVDRDNDSGN